MLPTKRENQEAGASLVEYVLLIAMLILVVLGSMLALSSSISQTFSEVSAPLK